MRWLAALLIIVASTISVQAEDWTTADGKTYKNVVVIGQENDGVRVTWEGGVGKLPYYELDDNTLRKLGQDPAAQAIKRAAFVKQQAESALQAQQDAAIAAEQKRKDAEAAALNAAQNGNSTAPQNSSSPQNATPGQNPVPGQTPAPGPNSAAQNATPGQNPIPGQTPTPGQNPTATTQTPGQPQNPAQTPGQPAPGANPSAAQNGSPQPNFVPPTNPNPRPAPAPAPAAGDTASSSSATDEQQNEYPNSKFQYDDNADVSYLESSVVEIEPVSPEAAPTPGQSTTIHFRITTEGSRAESPDEVQGFFYSSVPLKKLATDRKVKFLVDGAFIPTQQPVESPDADPDPQRTNHVDFLLSPEQTRAILSGKKVNVNVAGYDYRIGDAAMASLHGFMADVTKLPPASTNYMKAFHRFVNRLPSIISVISATCEYIILSAFGIVVVASIAAFVMGLTRFIKM